MTANSDNSDGGEQPAENWSPGSWEARPAAQHVAYPDPSALGRALDEIAGLPPLVTVLEIEKLKDLLAKAAAGERFLLQGGDCSEDFSDCEPAIITSKLKILLQMSVVLIYGCRKRIINVARLAGQYTKPRSSLTETRGELTLPSYRGCNINRSGFSSEERTPDPGLLLQGYYNAALTLNFIRSLGQGGFADLHHPEQWDLDFVGESPQADEYRQVVQAIQESVGFLESITESNIDQLNRVQFFTSHEALHLPYEQAQTKPGPDGGWYNLTTHYPWIGDRTRALDGAHVEYARGIENPLGVKVGPTMSADELLRLIDVLSPDNRPGRLTLIHRFGAGQIDDCLPPLIDAVARHGAVVLWCCDPMHGNTRNTAAGTKTRVFDEIRSELDRAFDIHQAAGSILGGVHFELTGENVTECLGGARSLSEADLGHAYKSLVDPRLNCEQALELALLIAQRMRRSSS